MIVLNACFDYEFMICHWHMINQIKWNTVCSQSEYAGNCPSDLHMWLLRFAWIGKPVLPTNMVSVAPKYILWAHPIIIWCRHESNWSSVLGHDDLVVDILPDRTDIAHLVLLQGLMNEISTDNHIPIVVWSFLAVHTLFQFISSVMFECLKSAWRCASVFVRECVQICDAIACKHAFAYQDFIMNLINDVHCRLVVDVGHWS